ncbi:glycosyl hydrolase [Mucilaginibacter boryungensis]|uniref:Glycoside hydrolase n=1 Tax=Mucilaginibacter boryungensis TaxID=768480 RepID=A0ABR9XD92_9SPHI|nr:glycosyl hydrolase [Mucilaginibacter boryungensis]MBE9665034.1 glycoside hydrolase [Mucilaginibacter boryungensis]
MALFYRTRILLLAFACVFIIKTTVNAQISTAKPWTYWWWMGGAVNEKDIQHSLLEFKRIGIGGVHIIPIYGVRGYEKEFKPFLGDKWMHQLAFTIAEGKKLGIGVDLSTGSGWPFGGPNVSESQSAKKWVLKNGQFITASTQQKVKRPSPGGAGYVEDPFDKNMMQQYLLRFDSAFANKNMTGLRAMYCDSYEVFGANWTGNFLTEFKNRRGYDLQSVAPLFLDTTNNPQSRLVKIDYQQTLSELLYDSYKTWADWSAAHGFITRYQAHGSPGNLLDLYSLASIPETEAFGSSNFKIPLLRVEPDYEPKNFGRPNPLMMKFASSAGGVSNKQLISSETCTWLANHFKVSLSQAKPQVDELFAAGINHVFFHGTTYSPQDEKYPGWLFYASTNWGPSSHFYNELPLLNKYIYNCQNILQNSRPDNDVLVYFPVQDIWADKNSGNYGIHQLDVHHYDSWFMAQPFGKMCTELSQKGFLFDYISDKQLNDIKVTGGKLRAAGATYKMIVVPNCTYLSVETLQRLQLLSRQGATIIFDEALPHFPMGYHNFETNADIFEKIKTASEADKKHFTVSRNLVADMLKHGATQETIISENGLSCIRKKQHGKTVYFISNLSNKFSEGWVNLSIGNEKVSGYDPLTSKKFGFAKKGKKIYLSLPPGQSCFVMEQPTATPGGTEPKKYDSYAVNTKWEVQFMGGRPNYHKSFKIDTLQSWTNLSDTAAFYTGTAKYTGIINIPAKVTDKKDMVIDLGTVNESATVKINGKMIGTAWAIPFRLTIPQNVIKAGENTLEIAVTNLSANYMRVYDKEHPEWKKFYDANIVDITYQPFNASKWPIMPSGLSTNNVKILYR